MSITTRRQWVLAAAVAVGISGVSRAADQYWDINGTTDGAGGATPTGTWDTTVTNWNTDPLGGTVGTVGPWVPGNTAIFSAGSDAIGSFTVTLNGVQTAAGLTIQEGTVALAGSALALGAGTATVSSGATLSIPSSANITHTAGGGGLLLDGSTLINTNAGNAGSFYSANANIRLGAGGGTVVYNINGAGLVSIYAGTIVRDAAVPVGTLVTLTKNGTGEFRYQGTGLPGSTYDKLVVNAGLFRLGFASATQDERGFGAVPAAPLADAITLNGGSIGASFVVVLHPNRGLTLGASGGTIITGGGAFTIPSSISGSGNLIKNTTGQLTLSGDNSTWTGAPVVTAGTLSLNSDTAVPATSTISLTATVANVVLNNTSVTPATITTNVASPISVGAPTGTFTTDLVAATGNTLNLNGPISGVGPLFRGRTASGGVVALNADNSAFSGGITVQSGTLALGHKNALGTADAATLPVSTTIAPKFASTTNLTGANAVANNIKLGRAVVSATDVFTTQLGGVNSLELTGTISDAVSGSAGAIEKVDANTVTLGGNNTYTGATTVSAGTLRINGTHTGGAAVTVAATGTLGGSGTLASTGVTVNGAVNPGNVAPGTLTVSSGSVTFGASSSLAIDLAGAAGDRLSVTSGSATIDPTTALSVSVDTANRPLRTTSFTVLSANSLSGSFAGLNSFGLLAVANDNAALGISYGPGSVVLDSFTRRGDVNLDGFVNNTDIAAFVTQLTNPTQPTGFTGFAADADGNGVLNNNDISPFVILLLAGGVPSDDPAFGALSVVPEPTSLALLGLGGLALRRRRR